MPSAKQIAEELVEKAGLTINGGKPWDPRVHDERFYRRAIAQGSLGLAEAYVDGWWDVEDLEELVARMIRSGAAQHRPRDPRMLWTLLQSRLQNRQTKRRSKAVAERHYDLGNDLYGDMLDPYRQYSCAYFQDTDDLDAAQEKKMNLICRKLGITASDRVLDIGCGWGGLAKFMAERHGCHVTGVTISEEQAAFAREWTKGLPVEILLKDYRDVEGSFTKVVSVGMFEHVGVFNYRTFMQTVRSCLADDGLFLLHTIGSNRSENRFDPWLERYIFPNSMLPSAAQIGAAFDGLFVMEDWHNFGAHYEKTLRAWHRNFVRNWPAHRDRYGERFYRIWTYYLLSCAGSFKARWIQLWQIVLSPQGIPRGYESVR